MSKILFVIMLLLTKEAYAKIQDYEQYKDRDQRNPVMFPEKESDPYPYIYWYEDESTLIEVIE